MSILRELSAYKVPVKITEDRDEKYEALLESIEDLYERFNIFSKKGDAEAAAPKKDPMKKLQMARIHTVVLDPSDKSFGIKDKVFGIRNENPIVGFMLDILGVPMDGSPIRIRTGFMQYDERSKMLFIARFKTDLPGAKRAETEPKEEE